METLRRISPPKILNIDGVNIHHIEDNYGRVPFINIGNQLFRIKFVQKINPITRLMVTESTKIYLQQWKI